jgi:hypothetical protein
MSEIIRDIFEAGYSPVRVGRDSKVSFVRWNTREESLGIMLHHAKQGGNVGVKVGKTKGGTTVAVVDRDDRKQDTWRFIQSHGLLKSNMQVETASGNWHLYFQVVGMTEEMKTKIKIVLDGKKLPIDLKVSGYVMFPPSEINGKAYQFREGKGLKRPEDLEPLPQSVIDVVMSTKNDTKAVVNNSGGMEKNAIPRSHSRIARPDLYCLKISSVMGSNGSAGLVRAVCVCRDAGWTPQQALEFLSTTWNERCAVPKWSDAEIWYAIRRHYRID